MEHSNWDFNKDVYEIMERTKEETLDKTKICLFVFASVSFGVVLCMCECEMCFVYVFVCV